MVERANILPPQSLMGPADPAEGQRRIEDFQDGQNRLNAEIEAKQQLLRGKFDELTRYLDRFM